MSIPFTYLRRMLPVLPVLVLALLLPGGVYSQAEAPATGTSGAAIPGIDELPAAAYPEGDPRHGQPEPAARKTDTVATRTDNQNNTQNQNNSQAGNNQNNLAGRFPFIRNIRVEKEPEFPHSVRIRGDVDPANDTAIYVGRYTRPLATRELVLEAENLTSPPLGPRATSYVDRNIPDGAYYYVVVTTFEMSKRESISLQPNVNYTTSPSIIYRDGNHNQPDQQNNSTSDATPEIASLYAVNAGPGVKLSWQPPNRNDIRFAVYRSEQPLQTPAAVQSATRLAVLPANQFTYEDRAPVANRNVYYGVSVIENASNREHAALTLNRSYIAHTYVPESGPTNDNGEPPSDGLPDALTTFLVNRDTVRLLWVEPAGDEVRGYRIYRASRPIRDSRALRQASLIGTVAAGQSSFQDMDLRPGTYYYAVLPRDRSGRERLEFRESRTFTGFPVKISDSQTEPDNQNESDVVDSISEEEKNELKEPVVEFFRGRSGIHEAELNWEIARPELSDFRILLFRSDKPMQELAQVRERGKLVATLDSTRRKHTDRELPAGRYYYALILDFADHVQETMTVGRNYLAFPVLVGAKEEPLPETKDQRQEIFEGDLYELNRILALTYHKNRYGETIRRLAPFVNSQAVAENVRAKALLYTGLALYHTRQYQSGLNYFLNPVVRRYYPDRAEFWYNRSIKRIR